VADLTFRPTTAADIMYVADNMRQADVEEVYAACWHTPEQALIASVKLSEEVFTVLSPENTPLVIFGVCRRSILSTSAVPWLLGCDEALRYPRQFIQRGREIVAGMLGKYDYLENYVHAKNSVSRRWLRRLGFVIEEPVLFKHTGEYFMRFHKEK